MNLLLTVFHLFSCFVFYRLLFPFYPYFLASFLLFSLVVSQDLPALYLKGGSIIPVGPPIQHVGEANLSDDLTLLVALDEHGKCTVHIFNLGNSYSSAKTI